MLYLFILFAGGEHSYAKNDARIMFSCFYMDIKLKFCIKNEINRRMIWQSIMQVNNVSKTKHGESAKTVNSKNK